MTTFVCVHGAFRGGWSFAPLRRELHAAGHDVFTPSLTGMGDRAHLRPDPLDLSTWVTDIVAVVRCEALTSVRLVGHSQGGVVIVAASQQLADVVEELIFLDAPCPRPGERAVDLTEHPPGVELPPAGTWLPPRALDESSGLDEATRAAMNNRLCATPLGPSLDPVVLDDPQALAIPRRFLFCQRTPEGYPSVTERRRCDVEGIPYTLLDAPHDVIWTHPVEVARFCLGTL